MPSLNNISVDGVVYSIGKEITYIGAATSSSPFVLEGHAPGIYMFDTGAPHIKRLSADSGDWSNPIQNALIILIETPTSSTADGTLLFTYWNGEHGSFSMVGSSNSASAEWGGLTNLGNISGTGNTVFTTRNQTISGKKTFSTLPESSVAPTTNNQLVNKQYVDNHDYNITSGTTDPSGGSDGDIYLKYEA